MKGWWPKSSERPSKPGKPNFFGGISQDFAGKSWRCPKSLRKKVCVQFSFPIFGPHRVRWRELSEFRSAYHLCVPKRTHRVCRRTHRVLRSTLETAFRPFPRDMITQHVDFQCSIFRQYLTGTLFTGNFRKCSPSKCCKLAVSAGTVFSGKKWQKERSHLDGERSRMCQHLSPFNCENRPLINRPLDTA